MDPHLSPHPATYDTIETGLRSANDVESLSKSKRKGIPFVAAATGTLLLALLALALWACVLPKGTMSTTSLHVLIPSIITTPLATGPNHGKPTNFGRPAKTVFSGQPLRVHGQPLRVHGQTRQESAHFNSIAAESSIAALGRDVHTGISGNVRPSADSAQYLAMPNVTVVGIVGIAFGILSFMAGKAYGNSAPREMERIAFMSVEAEEVQTESKPKPVRKTNQGMKARLIAEDFKLKTLPQGFRLYNLPQRTLVFNDSDVYSVADFFPEEMREEFCGWYENYKETVMTPPPNGPGYTQEQVMVIFNRFIDRMILLSKDKFEFESRHTLIEEPYNYFEYGQEYVRSLIDWDKSWLGHMDRWDEAAAALKRGDNVVLLTNHQTEADAAFIPLFFEKHNSEFGRAVFYVAGDRVTNQAIVAPFSMGKNLFCVYSKKYIEMEEDSDVKAAMSKQNRGTLMEMSRAMKKGGTLIWVAPHGGRDRLVQETGRSTPAAFDAASVEMFRSLGAKAGRPTHLYPMAMATHSIMPPNSVRQKSMGEERVLQYSGTAITLGPEVDQSETAAWRALYEDLDPKEALMQHVYKQVCKEYDGIEPVMKDWYKAGYVPPGGAQPWKS